MVRGKFIAIQANFKKQKKYQIKASRKRRTQNSKISRRKEILKIRAEVNEMKTIAKINKTKSLFFEKINKFDKPLARLIQKKTEKTQIKKIRKQKGEMKTDNSEMQRIIRDSERAMATHSSTLAWKIPWAEETGRLQSMGSLRVGHDWETSLSLYAFLFFFRGSGRAVKGHRALKQTWTGWSQPHKGTARRSWEHSSQKPCPQAR